MPDASHLDAFAHAARLQRELELLAAELEARAQAVRARAGEAGTLVESLGQALVPAAAAASAPAPEPAPAPALAAVSAPEPAPPPAPAREAVAAPAARPAPAPAPRAVPEPEPEPAPEPTSLAEWLAARPAFQAPHARRDDGWSARLVLSPLADLLAAVRVTADALCALGSIARFDDELLASRFERVPSGATLRSEGFAENSTLVWAARLQQPRAAGGYLATEATLRHDGRAAAPVVTLRSYSYNHNGAPDDAPDLRSLLRLTQPLAERVGLAEALLAETLDDDAAAERLARRLADPQRGTAIVLVSPRARSEHYLVDAEALARMLLGVAEVVRIGPTIDSYDLGDILGERHHAFNGAVNVLGRAGRYGVPSRRYVSRELEAMGSAAEVLHGLARAAMALADPPIPEHLRPEDVREAAARFGARHLALPPLPAPADEPGATAASAAPEPDPAAAEIARLSAALEQVRQTEEERHEARAALHDALLSAVGRDTGERISEHEARVALLLAALPHPTPEEALAATLLLFPERLLVLEPAWSSAARSAAFTRGSRLLELLLALAGPFWEALSAGAPESEARQVLGSAYAARESDTARGNRRARELRTFVYEGEPVMMERHLRIGTKPSIAETIRVHFHWDAERGKLVVGHCGEHLDHN